MISNETQYDNEQLAQLQNELKDNQLYSGIGIIPGTDTGGSSEGGENGTGGGSNQGGSNTGTNTGGNTGSNTNTGGGGQNQNANVKPSENQNPGGGTIIDGKTDEDPKFYVVSGDEIAASFYQSDVTIQIFTNERAKKIKYILTTTVQEISDELYPSGLVRELDIENGGTLTFTKDGEYTITAYAYDTAGNKSNPTIMWFKRQTGGSTTGGITVSIASGNEGANKWYTSNVTLRVLGTDTGSKKIKYRVRGTATSTGQIGDKDVLTPGNFDSGEVEITNGTTFRIVADGTYSITAYSYDAGGMRLSSSEVLTLKKDATRPTVQSYTGEQIPGQGFKVKVNAVDNGAGLTSNAYTYRHKESSSLGEYTSSEPTGNAEKMYTGLEQTKTYDMYVMVTDQAGNIAITDVIARPSLWISNNPTAGETTAEGGRSYYRSDTIEMKFRGQDSNNVDIMKTTYQILGTVDKEGSIAGNTVTVGQELPTDEYQLGDKETRTISLQADGNWTVKVHNYNKEGKLVTTNTVEVTRDITGPQVQSFTTASTNNVTQVNGTVNASWGASGQATGGGYSYYLGTSNQGTKTATTHTYTGINLNTINTIKVTLKDKAGNIVSNVAPTKWNTYLVDLVSLGEYVAYDAGTWGSTVGNPTSNATFGGYTAGTNKGTGLNGTPSGWRVLSKSGSGATGTLTLVSAGNPVNGYYGDTSAKRTEMISSMNAFAQNNFVNSSYTSSARCCDNGDFNQLGLANARGINATYWLATAGASGVNFGGSGSGTKYGTGYLWYAATSSAWTGCMDSTSRTWYSGGVVQTKWFLKNVSNSGSLISSSGTAVVQKNLGSNYAFGIGTATSGITPTYIDYTVKTLFGTTPTNADGSINIVSGIRPVITLKTGVICDGGITFLGNNAWSMNK